MAKSQYSNMENIETETEYWIPNAFSEDHTNIVLEGVKKVVNDSHGTGYAAHGCCTW